MTSPAIDQDVLRAAAARRLNVIRPDLAEQFDLADPASLASAYATAMSSDADPPAAGDVLAVVVLRRVELAAWLRGTCLFAQGLAPAAAAAWRRSFTRTIFLAGNPANLVGRFTFDYIAPDGSAAWLAPRPAAATMTLRRLLTAFDIDAALPPLSGTVELLSGAPERAPLDHQVHVATAGMRLTDSLIALNHLLVEAVLDRHIRPGDTLTLHRSPTLAGVPGPFTAIRAMPDPVDAQRLRAQACLTRRDSTPITTPFRGDDT